MDDDIMPNDGSFFNPFQEPPEQKLARRKEQARALEVKPVIENIIQHFNERIAYRDTIESLAVDLLDDPAMHQKKCEVNELLKLALMEEKQMLEELLETYAKNR